MEAASTEPSPATQDDAFAEKPELFVGAAFAGGLVLAGLLRWLGRDE